MSASRASDAYAQWISTYIDRGFVPFILTFMFNQLPGSPATNLDRMRLIIEHEYRIYLTQVVRKPHSASGHAQSPLWVFAPDLPVYKRQKQSLREVSVNDGRHFQGWALAPLDRKRRTITEYFAARMQRERSHCRDISRVDLEPVTHDLEVVAEYLFKTIERGRFGDDSILILPKARSEVTDGPRLRGNSSIFG